MPRPTAEKLEDKGEIRWRQTSSQKIEARGLRSPIRLNGGHYTWFAKLIVAGEILIGAALILGLFTGIAAFLGGFLNWNFMMAGTASSNPVLFTIAILLILAWKTAGWLGLDRWALPLLGTPWWRGKIFGEQKETGASTSA